ncbi:MAG: hypothetical protein GC164_10830 [Phycisphaera sp.]|nr:hypothetical protein [Phycisphaera sp.]
MVDLFRCALRLQGHLEKLEARYCFIGGVALQRWGEPRLTLDVDVTVYTGSHDELGFIQSLLNIYPPRYDNTVDFARTRRILLLNDNQQSIGIDISLGALMYEERVIERATRYDFWGGIKLLTCSAEDLVVLKAFADRGQDWVDIEYVLVRQGDKLDRLLIERELGPLVELKEDPEIMEKWHKLARTIG